MVVGYSCTNCGYKYECNVSESGERLCPDCENTVTGITGDISGSGDTFEVTYHEQKDGATPNNQTQTVAAHDAETAYHRTDENTDKTITVTRIIRRN